MAAPAPIPELAPVMRITLSERELTLFDAIIGKRKPKFDKGNRAEIQNLLLHYTQSKILCSAQAATSALVTS